jgi:hypothetical protein
MEFLDGDKDKIGQLDTFIRINYKDLKLAQIGILSHSLTVAGIDVESFKDLIIHKFRW